jgi:hypothetical protein
VHDFIILQVSFGVHCVLALTVESCPREGMQCVSTAHIQIPILSMPELTTRRINAYSKPIMPGYV